MSTLLDTNFDSTQHHLNHFIYLVAYLGSIQRIFIYFYSFGSFDELFSDNWWYLLRLTIIYSLWRSQVSHRPLVLYVPMLQAWSTVMSVIYRCRDYCRVSRKWAPISKFEIVFLICFHRVLFGSNYAQMMGSNESISSSNKNPVLRQFRIILIFFQFWFFLRYYFLTLKKLSKSLIDRKKFN